MNLYAIILALIVLTLLTVTDRKRDDWHKEAVA